MGRGEGKIEQGDNKERELTGQREGRMEPREDKVGLKRGKVDQEELKGRNIAKIVGGVALTLVTGVVLGTAGFFGFWAMRLLGQGYDWGDIGVVFSNQLQNEVATRPYSETVDEALTSEEFQVDNLERYYEVEFAEVEDLTGRINRLTEVGYGVDEIEAVNRKLGDESVEWVVEQGYLAELGEMLGLDYFWEENLARYVAALEKSGEDSAEETEAGGNDSATDGASSYVKSRRAEIETENGVVFGGGTVTVTEVETDNAVAAGKVENAVVRVNIGLDLEPYEDVTEVEGFDTLMVVNKYHHLDKEYLPEEITEVRQDCVKGSERAELAGVAAEAFEEMCLAARTEGLGLVANSAYRGYEEQEEVLEEQTEQFGAAYAAEYVSRPGFSEHQTGLALDVAAADAEVFKGTPEYNWMLKNAAKYGFILRYLEGKEEITGYGAEAWHLRYVGTEVAEEITEKGETLEEYIAKLPK